MHGTERQAAWRHGQAAWRLATLLTDYFVWSALSLPAPLLKRHTLARPQKTLTASGYRELSSDPLNPIPSSRQIAAVGLATPHTGGPSRRGEDARTEAGLRPPQGHGEGRGPRRRSTNPLATQQPGTTTTRLHDRRLVAALLLAGDGASVRARLALRLPSLELPGREGGSERRGPKSCGRCGPPAGQVHRERAEVRSSEGDLGGGLGGAGGRVGGWGGVLHAPTRRGTSRAPTCLASCSQAGGVKRRRSRLGPRQREWFGACTAARPRRSRTCSQRTPCEEAPSAPRRPFKQGALALVPRVVIPDSDGGRRVARSP